MHFPLLALCAFVLPASQQHVFLPWSHGPLSPCLDFTPENTLDWPSDPAFGTPAGFGRTVLADLDGDQSVDGVLVADGIPVALWKVAVYDALQRIEFPTEADPTDVRGIAALPGGGAGGRDALALTDERGLYLVTYGTSGFEDPQILDASAWDDAAPIHADDLDGDGDLDLVGVALDGRTILTMLGTPSGFVPGLAVYASRPTWDVVAVEWNTIPGRELVLLTNRGLVILNAQGAQIGSVLWPSGPAAITRIHSGSIELLAWSRVSGATTSELVVRNQTLVEGPWPLAIDICGTLESITPIALLAGNYDDNDHDELLIVHEGSETAVMLANKGSTPHFDPADPFAHDVLALAELPAAPGNVGIPAFGQVDGEELDDLVFPVASTGKVEVFRTLPFQRALGGSPATMVVVSEHTEFGHATADPQDPNHLRLAFVVPGNYLGHTKVQITVWQQPDNAFPVELDAIYHALHPLVTNGGTTVSPPTQWVDIEHTFPAYGTSGKCWSETKPHYYTELRFVKVNPVTQVETRSPVYTGGFTLETCLLPPGETDYDYLLLQGIQNKEFDLLEHHGLTPDPVLSEQVVGRYVPMSAQPPFELNANPRPGIRVTGSNAVAFANQ